MNVPIQIDQMRVEQLRRVADLHNLPPQYLKTIEWNLRKDITEVEKVNVILKFKRKFLNVNIIYYLSGIASPV